MIAINFNCIDYNYTHCYTPTLFIEFKELKAISLSFFSNLKALNRKIIK